MKIKEINIIQFGKFKDRAWRFEDGMNVVAGDNESGKSTILAFIKFALYGVARKNPNIAVGERERAVSWNVGIAAGSLTLEDGNGRLYRIERAGRETAKGNYSDRVRIIDPSSGEEILQGEVPGEHFLGISAQSYDSMCNIKQLECSSVGGDAVKSVIDNLLSSGDENMSIQSALKALDLERRRLLHTNGRGGLVYETEAELDKLKSEHRSAVAFENECAKNRDELDKVEGSLKKAREEHALAQSLCDIHDDVLRLHKFNVLHELKGRNEALKKGSSELSANAGFDISKASYEAVAGLLGAKEALERSRAAFEDAKAEFDASSAALGALELENEAGFSALIEEYGSPRAAAGFLSAKKKKKSSSVFLFSAFGIAGAVLLALAAILAFVLQNGAGGATVAFLGASLFAAAMVFFRQFKLADAEIKDFLTHISSDDLKNNEEKLLSELESYSESTLRKSRLSNACESAKFRLSAVSDTFDAELAAARRKLISLGITASENEEAALCGIAERMRSYLSSKAELEEKIRENNALIASLSNELERFSEKDLRTRITPEIEESVKSSSFESLKAQRDNALKRISQISQYKAGIERNLSAGASRRTPSEIFPELEAKEALLECLKLRLDAVRLAAETINAASLELKSDITPRIRERAEAHLSTMTEGRYSELLIDEGMSLSVFADGATRPIDSLSRGSLDVAYFSVRLALLSTLLGDVDPPVYADEILSQLDENRARGVIAALNEHSRTAQCILFTCRRHDLELVKEAVPDANVIDLNI